MNVSLARSLIFFFAGLGLLAGIAGCGGPANADHPGEQERPPPPVTSVEVHPEDVKVTGDYAGRIRGARQVEVRSRVGGILEERLYTEGQVVDQGEALFQIDARPFEIALQQAEAELANARADLSQAEREWDRVSRLHDQNAVSERERDRAQSDLELAEARIGLAEAMKAEAELNLGYTRVQAPIAGPTGLETFSEGSLIEKGTLLTTIVQQDPVHVRFSVPEKDAAVQRAARKAMIDREGDHRREAQLVLPGGAVYDVPGEVDFTDTTIDARTGTVSARAIFANPDGEVIPGQFARVRITHQNLDDVFRIDPAAVGQGPEGPRVFVLQDENTVESRPVRVGPVVEGKQVVLEGLEPGERLVVNGHAALEDGMTVAADAQNEEDR